MYARRELVAHLRALGLALGDTVMVHASVRAVGTVAGGPDRIHLAIKDAIGAARRATTARSSSCCAPGRARA